jgi:predicted Zn-dependent protease
MRAGFLGAAWARLFAWRRQHPWQAALGLVLLAALLGWAGYRAWRYFAARADLGAAQQALNRHQWSEARTHLAACLRTWPDSPEAHLLAARAARRLQLLGEAAEHLDACDRLRGDPQATRVERALLRVQRGDLASAETFLCDAVARDDPDAAEILDVLATALLLERRVPEAHRCLDDLLRRRPDDFELLVRHATTAQNQAWHSVAAESLGKAVALRPEDHEVRLTLAQELVTIGRYADAQEHLACLRRKEPDNPAVVFTLARCLAWQGQKQQAAKLLDGLLAAEPNNVTLLAERGWLCLELDQPAEAEPFLRRAQSLAKPDQVILTRLADCLRLLGKNDEARQYREQAERLRADTVQAAQLSKRIREERPVDPNLCHQLAGVYLRLYQEENALYYFEKALEQDPHHRPTHESLAAYYARTGDLGRAAYHKRQLRQGP